MARSMIRENEKQVEPTGSGRYISALAQPAAAAEPAKVTWEEAHVRWTFHISRDVLEALKAEAARSGRGNSSVADDLLRAGLGL